MSSQQSGQCFSASEAELIKDLFIPEPGYAILSGIRDPSPRRKFLEGVVSMNEAGLSKDEITSYYKYLPPDRVPGYRPDRPGRENDANQGRPRNNGGQQAGESSDPMSQQFSRLGLSGNLHPVPYLPLIRTNVLYNGRPSEQHRQSLLT